MLLLLLLHLAIYHLLSARDVPPPKDTKYLIKPIDTCPSVGYFFKRDTPANSLIPGTCYLCFCQEDDTAICWKRENRRCDARSFQYHGIEKRDTRMRRSPGFADLFFRDATRDVFNKNTKTECKPFESSFSDDCPPADWCTGCTVCDCDANGRWDCHLLSFCPDDKAKKKSKRKGARTVVAKKPIKKSKSFVPPKMPSKPVKNNKTTYKGKPNTIPPMKHGGNNNVPPQKRIVKKSAPYRQTPAPQRKKTPIRYKRIPTGRTEPTKEMIIKKNIATHKPINIGASKVNLEMEIARKVMKNVMANLRKSISGEMQNITKMATIAAQRNNPKYMKNFKKPGGKPKPKPKKVNKRQVKKPQRKTLNRKPPPKPKIPMKKPIKKPVKKPVKKPIKKPVSKKPPNKYVRNKRDVNMTEDTNETKTSTSFAQGNPEESTNTTVLFSVTPMTSNLLVPDDDNCSHTLEERSTLPESEYYKYVIGIEHPEVTVDENLRVKGISQVNRTETVFNLLGTRMNPIVSTEISPIQNIEKANNITNFTINPEANDLKYSKWANLKILKEKKIKSSSDKHKRLVKLITHSNKTIYFQDPKKKVQGKEVEKILNSRKFNIVKLLNLPKCKEKRHKNQNSTDVQKANKNNGNLQNLLSNIMKDFHKNSTVHPPKKNKRFSVLRYLKRIFNKIFKHKKTPDQFSKHHLIRTLCENFGPCKLNKKDKILLDAKLTDLDVETTKILRIVKIIKGLLKLVELPNSVEPDSSYQKNNFRNDIQKLNAILKKSYAKGDQVDLSSTQLTQIEYIKQNTKDLIKSVTKFASLLNEIMLILKKDYTNHSENITHIPDTNISKNVTKDDPFQSLRHLLVRYNLIQNTFMKRIYEQINNFENKVNEKTKVSEVNSQDLNNSVAIENFSRNIIQNLRKLKRLAQTVSYSGRTKRETMRDDDTIEYLLMLMEYMLKQNYPLDAAPANDGIDLLIEAIKSAPDIKSIRKKVLENTPAPYPDSNTTPINFVTYVTTEGFISEDESPSESDKTSNEDSDRTRINKLEDNEENLKNRAEENKELVEIIAEDDKDPGDKFQLDRRAGNEKVDDITEMTFFNKVEDNLVLESDNIFESTTTMALDIEISDKLENQEDTIMMDKPVPEESNKLDKPTEEGGADDKKFEVFTGDMEDELILSSTITTSDAPITMPTELAEAEARKSRSKMRHLNLESIDSEGVDKKSKLEWIEENFGRENEKELIEFEENNTTQVVTVTPKPIISSTERVDISTLTKEMIEEADKKKKAKLAEEVMLRKQMDLLNSLDYGTEKGELYESDSKDSNVEDRYSSDPYPSYFV